ncbi:MAG: hypothetical protein ACYDBY_11825 [Thermoanaerobaculia bacterium]
MVGLSLPSGHDHLLKVIAVCEEVLAGQLSIEAFFDRWPSETDDEPLLQAVREDAEDAVEHTPARFFRGGVDSSAWSRSEQFLTLLLDVRLLRLVVSHGLPVETIIAARQRALTAGVPAESEIDTLAEALARSDR